MNRPSQTGSPDSESQEGQDLTEAFYDLKGDEKYVRLEIMAADGEKA